MEADLEFLQEKWRVWFNLLDINRDGVLTSSDWNTGAETLIKENNLKPEQAEIARENFENLGIKLLGDGHLKKKGKAEKHELVDNLTAFYKESSNKAYQYIHDIALHLFMLTDVDCNSVVSRKEFTAICKSLGIQSDSAAAFYETLKHADCERVPVEAAVNWWVDVFFGTDRDQWERFKNITSENC
ncbi:sarcoplasmic calcium-binding protein-like [Liolophura sinensis]|uniref:sarcoplasmic calcium-binding protein-like n=1 Tax=Liolophura sinensis TaxID=3198878 RepID=UPI0031595536